MAGGLIFQVGTSPVTYAATTCPASAHPDVSTGLQGQVQSYSVLTNDNPSPGSTFVLSSLRLGIVTGQVLGTSISDDKKTVSTPDEGVYLAQSDGIIRFTPDPDFVGQAKGVEYFIDDSAGVTSSSTYQPTVTSTVVACTTPESEGITLVSKQLVISGDQFENGQITEGKIDDTSPDGWDNVIVSTGGENLILIGNGKPYTSNNGGATVQQSHVPENLDWDELVGSSDGQKALANVYDQNTGIQSLYTTSDGGMTWLKRLDSSLGSISELTSSPNGLVLAALDYTLGGYRLQISTDGGVTWNERDPGVSGGSYTISDAGSDVFMTDYVTNTLRVSHDGGVTWSTQSITVVTNFSPMLEVSGDGNTLVMFAQTYNIADKTQIFISTDDGATWVDRTGPWGDRFVETYDVSPDMQTMTLAVVDGSTYEGNIYRTINAGITWTQQMSFTDRTQWDVIAMTGDGNQLKALIYDYDLGTTRLHSSNDAGASWMVENTEAEQAFTPQQVDIDTATPGQQLTLDRTATEGWSAVYDPQTDTFTLTVTDSDLFDNSGTHQLEYSFIPLTGCEGPAGPASIVIRTITNAT